MEIFLILAAVCAVITGMIANSKGRDPFVWGIIGAAFGIIGVIAAALASDQSEAE